MSSLRCLYLLDAGRLLHWKGHDIINPPRHVSAGRPAHNENGKSQQDAQAWDWGPIKAYRREGRPDNGGLACEVQRDTSSSPRSTSASRLESLTSSSTLWQVVSQKQAMFRSISGLGVRQRRGRVYWWLRNE